MGVITCVHVNSRNRLKGAVCVGVCARCAPNVMLTGHRTRSFYSRCTPLVHACGSLAASRTRSSSPPTPCGSASCRATGTQVCGCFLLLFICVSVCVRARENVLLYAFALLLVVVVRSCVLCMCACVCACVCVWEGAVSMFGPCAPPPTYVGCNGGTQTPWTRRPPRWTALVVAAGGRVRRNCRC